MKRIRRIRDKGVYTVVLAMVLPLLIGFLGLGVDMSHYWWVRGQLQTAADAAALAGAKELNSTAARRVTAVQLASTYAREHTVNGAQVNDADMRRDETGHWDFTSKSFSADKISDASANAVHVTVERKDVPNFFIRALEGALATQTIAASAVAVAGGASRTECGFPVVFASCGLQHTDEGQLICPTDLTFASGMRSVGLAHPDGSGPVSGKNTAPYIREALKPACKQGIKVGQRLQMQNGNDLPDVTVKDINGATSNGAKPVPVVIPIVDVPCDGPAGPNYNRSAEVVGFIQLKLVGARGTDDAPPAVAAACPTLGKKNLCVVADCTTLANVPGGGTIQVIGSRVYLVD